MSFNTESGTWELMNDTSISYAAYPMTIGAWVRPEAGATLSTIICVSDSDVSDAFQLRRTTGLLASLAASATGETITSVASAWTANTWNYILGRFISATNRRLSTLFHTGAIEHASSAVSRATTGLSRMEVGSRFGANSWTGLIAELFMAEGDIQADSAADTNSSLLRQLAFGGPFSIPHVAEKVTEYHSYRAATRGESGYDAYYKKANLSGHWTARDTASHSLFTTLPIGPNPPLPYWCKRPGQVMRPLVF